MVDVFFQFFPDTMSIYEKAPYCIELSLDAILKLENMGYVVIVPYPISDADYERFMKRLVGHRVTTFTLVPEKEKLLSRLRLRDTDYAKHRRAFIEEHYKDEYGIVRPKYPSIIIDNSNLSPKQTAEKILHLLPRE